MLDVQSSWFSPATCLSCPPANGCRIQTALSPGSAPPAGAVVQLAGLNGRLAAQTPALGWPHRLRPHRPVLGTPPEICQLSLWIKTAARGKQLTSLDHTIREGNRVISDPAVHPKAFDWQAAFPELASRAKVEPAAKRRKRRKERESSSDEAAWAAGLAYPAQRILLDLELWGAKVDQQAVLNPR